MERSNDMLIYGKRYYAAGRYNYIAIDSTYENSSGGETLMTGILPQKLGLEFASKVQQVQAEALEHFTVAMLLYDSANSEELYLFATNIAELYHGPRQYSLTFVGCIKKLKTMLEDKGRTTARDWQNLVRGVQGIFFDATQLYEKEFPKGKGNEWYEFTPLDCYVCTLHWITEQKNEFAVNGLEGF